MQDQDDDEESSEYAVLMDGQQRGKQLGPSGFGFEMERGDSSLLHIKLKYLGRYGVQNIL